MKKFEIGKPNDYQKFNNWFEECTKQQIPYIIIKSRIKYSRVEWDHINLDPKFDKLFKQNQEELREEFLSLFNKYSIVKSKYVITNLTLIVDNLSKDCVNEFSEKLFDILTFFMEEKIRTNNKI